MIEFNQIIGRGTRIYDGKDYFTIYDFVKAHHFFSDPDWEGEPEEVTVAKPGVVVGPTPEPPDGAVWGAPEPPPAKIVVKLADGKARTIQSTERASSKRSHESSSDPGSTTARLFASSPWNSSRLGEPCRWRGRHAFRRSG